MASLHGGGKAPLVRTFFDAQAAWLKVTNAIASGGPGGLGAPVDIVEDESLAGASWARVLQRLPVDATTVVVFIADRVGLSNHPYTLLVADPAGEEDPFRCAPGAVWDVETNLESENLSFGELAAEARRLGGWLPADNADDVQDRPDPDEAAVAFARGPAKRGGRGTVPAPSRHEILVLVPLRTKDELDKLVATRGTSLNDIVREVVIRDSIDARPLTREQPDAENEVSAARVKLIVDGAIVVIMRGDAQARGFDHLEDYCAAMLRAIADAP